MKHTHTLAMSLLSTALIVACDPAPPAEAPAAREVALAVRTIDPSGEPVEMVRFYINGKKFGITDQDGRFQGDYPAKEGQLLVFNVEAPEGYMIDPTQDRGAWRHVLRYPKDGRGLVIAFTARLQPPPRDYTLMVKTRSPLMPVRVNGDVIGETDASGYSILPVQGVPATSFSVRAGEVVYRGRFSEDHEVYLLTPDHIGPLPKVAMEEAGVAEPSPPPEPRPPTPTPDPPIPTVDGDHHSPLPAPPVQPTPKATPVARGFETIEADFERTRLLTHDDIQALERFARSHARYGDAKLLLAGFYYEVGATPKQIEALEAATRWRRLKRDPQLRLSLAKAYAKNKQLRRAMQTMVRVERDMGRLGARKKADAYRFYAEVLEFEFLRQLHKDAQRVDPTLIDKAIHKLERYRTLSRGADAAAVRRATEKIEALEALKARVEL